MTPATLLMATPHATGDRADCRRALHLRPDGVDIWSAALDEQLPAVGQWMQTLLSPDEMERARRFYFERDRHRFIIGRGILRVILGWYLGRPPDQIVLHYGANGKPALAPIGAARPPLAFNLAHSDGLALYAFTAAGEVGIDIERIREIPEWEQIAAAHFSPRECAQLYYCPAERREAAFFRAWTRQEALLKALGVGLGANATSSANAPRRTDRSKTMPTADENAFAVHPLEAARGYVAALAVGHDARWATHLSWPAAATAPNDFSPPRSGRRTRLAIFSNTGTACL